MKFDSLALVFIALIFLGLFASAAIKYADIPEVQVSTRTGIPILKTYQDKKPSYYEKIYVR